MQFCKTSTIFCYMKAKFSIIFKSLLCPLPICIFFVINSKQKFIVLIFYFQSTPPKAPVVSMLQPPDGLLSVNAVCHFYRFELALPHLYIFCYKPETDMYRHNFLLLRYAAESTGSFHAATSARPFVRQCHFYRSELGRLGIRRL